MGGSVLYWTFAALLIAVLLLRSAAKPASSPYKGATHDSTTCAERTPRAEDTRLVQRLKAALPAIVLLPEDDHFPAVANVYWARQECEALPSCIVRPTTTEELSSAVKILKREYDDRRREEGYGVVGVFAIRSGGHSVPSGAASLRDGVLIDLSHFSGTVLSDDKKTATIGTGARWGAVYGALAPEGLAVAGGRNSHVGVGGLTLGGGLSFYSPRYGLVCNNIDSYEIVLASGEITTASKHENEHLWRALKGGSNNFGIVTRFTARTFPVSNIWGGYLYIPYFESKRALAAFHQTLATGDAGGTGTVYDEHAGALLCCFVYVHAIRLSLIATNLIYTGDVSQLRKNEWPAAWAQSPWSRLWRLWSSHTVRTLSNATDELDNLAAKDVRQGTATTTVLNDPATLTTAHAAWEHAITALRARNVEGGSWTLVFQPVLPLWTRKGDPNPLGLDVGTSSPLVNVSLTVNWALARDDDFMEATIRSTIEAIEVFAGEHETGHPYKYLNYAASWQKVFEGYGKENHRFLQDVSRHYDPDGLFQQGCTGGFKLGM